MSGTFRDVCKIKGLSPAMVSGRGPRQSGGYKEKQNGISRSASQGRQETFMNDAKMPPKLGGKSGRMYR